MIDKKAIVGNSKTKIITKTHPQEFFVKLNRLVLMYNKSKKIGGHHNEV